MKHKLNQFRKLRKPHKIRFMDKEFLIKPVPNKELQQWADKGETLYGYFDDIKSIIYIDNTLPQATYDRILLHELVHAVLSITGLTNLLKPDLEEAIADAMENLVYFIK